MITNGEKWHYLAVKLLLTLLLGTASKNNGEYYCISCLHSSEQKINLNHMEKYAEFSIILMLKCLKNTTRS